MAKVKTPKELPSFSRRITERVSNLKKNNSQLISRLKFQFKILALGLVSTIIFLLAFDFFVNLQKLNELNFEKTEAQSELKLWKQIADKYPGNKEAYFELSVLEYKIGDREKSKNYLQKALNIDPNFRKARDFGKNLY